ncbi:lipase family alpha/beta hydrolase [Amycolatopsis thermophila]|uniref:Pimeloyl-ACP methyl ester carboxylesterase n=1 Tax=Amycolatopsis thermophila TaxID=206084 RepID=A0ABU0ES21_9PSEU|nr:alpha/beta fold hydrolase [Amycolatopsis thermophila]MDQ0377811.1 pimeloyl-ACP methyl ester carboxylesterase [Amycolatopsis thermophila]
MLRTVAGEIASAVTHAVRYPAGIGRRWAIHPARRSAPPGDVRPLVVLPGLADNTAIFTNLKVALDRCGAGPIVSFSYSLLLRDVRSAAARLSEQVEQLCEVTGAAKLDLVGHSLGGLIARYYVQRLGGHHRVGTVVTVGTPHGGTVAAWLLSPMPLARQLRPGSDLLTELTRPAPHCTTKFVTFSSDGDELILPSRHGRFEHPDLEVRNVVLPGVGHLALAAHRQVVEEICALFGPVGATDDGDTLTRSA